jgi:hypothetical protein
MQSVVQIVDRRGGIEGPTSFRFLLDTGRLCKLARDQSGRSAHFLSSGEERMRTYLVLPGQSTRRNAAGPRAPGIDLCLQDSPALKDPAAELGGDAAAEAS